MSLDPSDYRNEAELEMSRVHPKVQDPIGVTFTPTAVIAYWFNDANELEYLTQPASPKVRGLYEITIENNRNGIYNTFEYGNTDDLKAMFLLDFVPLTVELTERLGHEPRYLSLFLSSVFDRAILNVGRQALKDTNNSHPMTGLANQAMGLPWGFFEGSKLGRKLPSWKYSEPKLEYRPNLVLVLEYEPDYLFAFSHNLCQ
jgi:hypothetical protein